MNRAPKQRDIKNAEIRARCESYLTSGRYTPLEFLKAISHSNDNVVAHGLSNPDLDGSDESSDEEQEQENQREVALPECPVCLGPRNESWCFIPCGHLCCRACSQIIVQREDRCPVCRREILSNQQIFLN